MKFGHPFKQYPKLILNCCPTGCVPTKVMNPHVPIAPEEIIRESLELANMGVSILHLHARDDEGNPTWSKSVYERMILGIREINPEVILCVSTSGRFWSDFERRSEVLELEGDAKPDMASLTPGSMNFLNNASVNSPQMYRDLIRKMNDRGIKPELEVFDAGMMDAINSLRQDGLVKDRPYINILLGNMGTAPADFGILSLMVDMAAKDTAIAVSGIGKCALAVHIAGMIAGLHVRVGLEDALFMDLEKKTHATNQALVHRLKELSSTIGRSIQTPLETRAILGI